MSQPPPRLPAPAPAPAPAATPTAAATLFVHQSVSDTFWGATLWQGIIKSTASAAIMPHIK